LATFVLIHGAASDSRDWDQLRPELKAMGHEVIAADLPCEDDSAGLNEYADSVVEAAGDASGIVVVGHSFGGFTAPLVCDRIETTLLVMVNGMLPAPGESPGEWWGNTGWNGRSAETEEEMMDVFPAELARTAIKRVKNQSGTPFEKPWPLTEWPPVRTRVLIGKDDRFLPAEFQRRVARERLGVTPDEMDGGHLLAVSRPHELAARIDGYLSSD
jgi:pimeloyl-ACP methyl ester carboxylesterase